MSEAADPRGGRAAALAALFVLAVLLATVDGRSYGLIPDGKEMLSAGAAVARFLEIGVSRDFVNAPRRAGGDAVSRYGMGLSLLEAVPAVLARAAPPSRAAALFVLLPILCLAACAWAAARTLLGLGAAPGSAALGGAALVLATPLWGYAGSDYGEPLQALCVALSVLALVELRDAPASARWQVVLGLAAGWAILTKTLLVLVVAPLLASALLGVEREETKKRRVDSRRAAPSSFALPWPLLIAFAGILFVWLVLEIARFGKLGGGYGGETFTYPFFTGLLRLTFLPNKGLFWYAPVTLFAVPGFLLLRRRDARLALALAASSVALLFASSAWWAWDGQAGWGPRLLLPALPCLLALAGLALAESGRGWRAAWSASAVAGVAVNALGALVPFPAVYALATRAPAQPIEEARAAGTPYEIARGADGILRATGPHHLSLTPAWSPIRVHALVLAARMRGGFDGTLPELDPPFRPETPPAAAPAFLLALSPPRPGWGRASGVDPYGDALRDQIVRAIDLKEYARAKALGDEVLEREEKSSANDPRTIALTAESIRLGGGEARSGSSGELSSRSRAAATLSFLSKKSSLFLSSSCHPWFLFVRAMAEPPGDVSCLPERSREGFAQGLEIARQRGWALTEWNRAATTGRP